MARYLLKAADERMERWKAVAKKRGLSFADFVREALDDASAPPKTGAKKPKPPPSPGPPPVAADSGKRSYLPDFKEGAKKR